MTTKHFRILCLSALLLGTACGNDDSGDGKTDPGSDQQQLKDEVRAACEQADADGTTRPSCPEAWLGDGVCDDFCQGGDADDCPVHCDALGCDDGGDDDGIACPAIWNEPDGHCDESDPCGPFTDGDCQGVACIDLAYPQDGCCQAAPGCEQNDPDCDIACTAEVREPDGECNADACDPDCQAACVRDGDGDGDDGDDGIACIEILYPTNGVCEAAPGCEYTDPEDCEDGIACPAIWREADGVCDPEDPCGPYNDEDCQVQTDPMAGG